MKYICQIEQVKYFGNNNYLSKNMLDNDQLRLMNLENQTLFSILQSKNLIESQFSGYIEAEFEREVNSSDLEKWYIFFSNGKIVFSNSQKIEFGNVLSSLQNYLPSLILDSLSNSNKTNDLVKRAKEDKNLSIKSYLEELALLTEKVDYKKIISAIQLHITVDSEKYLFENVKNLSLIEDPEIDKLQPITGFEVDNFLEIIEARKNQWENIKNSIPSLNFIVINNQDPDIWRRVSEKNQKNIKRVLSHGNTLQEIRSKLGEDPLKISRIFSNLVKNKLVTLEEDHSKDLASSGKNSDDESLVSDSLQEVFVIDDSQIVLKQIDHILNTLGYKSSCCDSPLEAIDLILESDPKAIFIDINMPEKSGFELMRDIRKTPKLKSIPVVILTGEGTIMNKQRAKWLKCDFLIKPLGSEDKPRFLSDIKSVLTKLVPA